MLLMMALGITVWNLSFCVYVSLSLSLSLSLSTSHLFFVTSLLHISTSKWVLRSLLNGQNMFCIFSNFHSFPHQNTSKKLKGVNKCLKGVEKVANGAHSNTWLRALSNYPVQNGKQSLGMQRSCSYPIPLHKYHIISIISYHIISYHIKVNMWAPLCWIFTTGSVPWRHAICKELEFYHQYLLAQKYGYLWC